MRATPPHLESEPLDAQLHSGSDGIRRRRVLIWAVGVLVMVTLLGVRAVAPDWFPMPQLDDWFPAGTALGLFVAALFCEFIDSALGMGYGTMLTPMLLLFGFQPLQVVPAILLSECLTGLTATLFHQRDGNVDFLRDPQARSTALWLSTLSVVGTLAAVTLALSVPGLWLKTIIGIIVVSVGVLILATVRRRLAYRRRHMIAIGALAAFNKAISGGGYGPLVTGGQVVSGVPSKQAVAITSLAESLVCFIGLVAYMVMGKALDWAVALPLTLGAMFSVPMATLTVRRLPEPVLRGVVGLTACVLGLLMIIKKIGG